MRPITPEDIIRHIGISSPRRRRPQTQQTVLFELPSALEEKGHPLTKGISRWTMTHVANCVPDSQVMLEIIQFKGGFPRDYFSFANLTLKLKNGSYKSPGLSFLYPSLGRLYSSAVASQPEKSEVLCQSQNTEDFSSLDICTWKLALNCVPSLRGGLNKELVGCQNLWGWEKVVSA